MKKYLAILALTLMTLGLPSKGVAGQSLFVWGNVRWATGFPAIGIELSLVRNDGTVISAVYTNQAGSYAFFGIEGQPSEYSLVVYDRDDVLKQIRVPEISIGYQVPDIILEQLLNMKLSAVPKTVAIGEKTKIIATVQDGKGFPVPNVRVTISAGGGKFLNRRESYDPRSRLHGPYKKIGHTDMNGNFTTLWVCNPCAAGYVLWVESSKDGYVTSASELTIYISQ